MGTSRDDALAVGLGGGQAVSAIAADVLAAVGALAECSVELEHEPLKGALGRSTAYLVTHIEGHCRELVTTLLRSTSGGSTDSDHLAYDKLWTLRLMGKRSQATRQWVVEAGGMDAVSQIMAAHPGHGKLQKEGTWLVYTLWGVDGVAELLRQNRGCSVIQEAASWAIYDVALRQRDGGQVGVAEWPQADTLVVLLLEALQTQNATLDLLWACCSALRLLVEAQPCRGTLFVARGGAEAALSALAAGQAAGAAGDTLLVAGMQLITSLVDGNAVVAQKLRSLGALNALVGCGLRLPGKVTDETMWTLGQVGGIMAVLQVMARAPAESEAVRSGLAAIAKLTWLPLEEGLQQQFPEAAKALLNLARRMEANSDMAEHTLQALGGVLNVLTPCMAPGTWQVVDDGVAILIEAVSATAHPLVAQAAVASMGHIAAHAPAWRKPLQRALGGIGQRMRMTVHSEDDISQSAKHQKNLFWASAAIAGLPVVLEEMRSQASSPQVQEAAISAIMDTLDGHADSPCALLYGEGGGVEPHEVPAAIATVAAAMRAHGTHERLQWCGCQALGLLHQVLPLGVAVPPEALDGVLSAMKRHPTDYKVSSGGCAALRAFLEPRQGRESATCGAVAAQVVGVLRNRDVATALRRLLEQFCTSSDKTLLEDALYVLGLVEGIPEVLRVLASSDSACLPMRSAGLKALFELVRTFPDLLSPRRAAATGAVANAISAEVSGANAAIAAVGGLNGDGRCAAGAASAESVELLRRAELVRGLLAAAAAGAGA